MALVLAAAFAGTLVAGASPLLSLGTLAVLTAFLWATLAIPAELTALVFFAALLLTGLAPDHVALAGFESKAVWLVFAGMVLSEVIGRHDMGHALFDRLLGHLKSYPALIWLISSTGLLLAFFIPSAMGRVLIFAPLVRALADRLGLAEDDPRRHGLFIAAVLGAVIPAFTILTSNVPNLVLMGAAEAIYGRTLTYGEYLLLNFPVLGLGAFLLIPLLVLRLFPGERQISLPPMTPEPWTRDQVKIAFLLAVTLAFWTTDSLHGISSAWIGLAAAVVSLLPGVGLLPPQSIGKLNFGPWFFAAGTIGLGGVVSHSGLGDLLWSHIAAAVPLAGLPDAAKYAVLQVSAMMLAMVTTLPAIPAVFTPLAGSMAESLRWPLDAVLLAQVPAFVIFAFPYQAPPVLVGLTFLGVPLRKAMKVMLYFVLLALVIVSPLHYLWGHLIGVFP
ncbi:SLC13 family permease [Pelagibius marinus]|uniref:SLC13 family permease n=1 Tax=Pelagibius marinus TaxID=2762760 RepID=UPI0018732E05|nr:SLC13 family permease [Pelagibius marinus]